MEDLCQPNSDQGIRNIKIALFVNSSIFQGTDCQTTYYGCLLEHLSKASVVPEMKIF